MSDTLDTLVNLLSLERIEENLFRGASQDLGFPQLFGGQVVGQALSAASQTVAPERHVHSMHGYFLRPGDSHQPVVYDVDRVRDGGSSPRAGSARSRKDRPSLPAARRSRPTRPGSSISCRCLTWSVPRTCSANGSCCTS